ncbi:MULTISPECIES: AAA family ATPase [Streptomyces]|uniref:AAA family ATPase n=1 Tax=Streptomyces TaxID=1883 RepID=UPI000F6DB110|nr:AAA family ATPase [Streptomyces sp. W1SF4]AZM87270.1 ATP/GTP-binding protein [Streptomyces sp. W1SF4]
MSTPTSTEDPTPRAQGSGKSVRRPGGTCPGRRIRPRGIVDLRGGADGDVRLSYPPNAAVVVAGLPGSGKSTLLRAWSPAAAVVDPRATRTAFESRMPAWLPYAVYRPWARLSHMRWMGSQMRLGHPLLIHDCGTRPWMRRWLAYTAHRGRRPLHMVVLDVGPQEALAGQHARRRLASPRVFTIHRRGLARLLARIARDGLPAGQGIGSVVLLDRRQRDRGAASVDFDDRPGLVEPAPPSARSSP